MTVSPPVRLAHRVRGGTLTAPEAVGGQSFDVQELRWVITVGSQLVHITKAWPSCGPG